MDETKDPIEPEVVEESRDLVRPSVPTTINELASHERGVQIIEQRLVIFNTMRVASIQLSMPNDWTLFKTEDGRISGYLGDQGCDRIKKLWGISVTPGKMERIDDLEHPGEFAYRITGDGTCGLTGEAVFDMEGVRYSTERYALEKPEGIQRSVAVQKAARANLDGGICRELAGLKSVPSEELDSAWKASKETWKKTELCNKGRGFGSAVQRAGGAAAHGIDGADIPNCEACENSKPSVLVKLVFRTGKDDREGFFGCPNWEKHKDKKVIIPLSKLKTQIEERNKQSRQPGEE